MQQIKERLYKKYEWKKKIVTGEDILKKRESHLSSIFYNNIKALEKLKEAIESAYDTWPVQNKTQIAKSEQCCNSENVNPDGCVKLSSLESLNDTLYSAKPPPQVLQVMKNNEESLVHVHMQYFAFEDGGVFFYPAQPKKQYLKCEDYDPRRRYFFVESKSPSDKDYVFVVNPGSTNKTILLTILSRALEDVTPNDRMGICLAGHPSCGAEMVLDHPSSGWPRGDTPLGGHTALNALITGSERNKGKFKTYMEHWIEKLEMMITEESPSVENHAKAVEAGLGLLEKGEHQENVIYENLYSRGERQRKLIYISQNLDSVVSWENHPRLTDIINSTLRDGIEVLTCNINDNITHQDRVCERLKTNNNDSTSAENKNNTSERPLVLLPYWDASGQGLITSVCLALKKEGIFKGAVCTDLSIIDDLEDALTIKNIEGAYMFLVDTSGHALVHPLLPAPHSYKQHPTYVHISKLEPDKKLIPIHTSMAQMKTGTKEVTVLQPQPVGRIMNTQQPETVRLRRQKLKYLWAPINNTDFSIAIVLPIKSGQIVSSSYKCHNECITVDFQYHRLDLDILNDPKTCQFFCIKAYKDHGMVKFAPSSYRRVMKYVRDETEADVKKLYGIFRQDRPYDEMFKNDMQHSMDFVEAAEKSWNDGRNLSDYVGVRYMGTANGIVMAFPGAELQSVYDPRLRPWYQMAMSNLDTNKSVSLTTPYCDPWGAGLTYTVAMALRGNEYEAVAVIGADIKSEYLLTIFLEHVPECNNKFRCILAESSGYVVFDSYWNDEPMNCNPRSKLEAVHLTAKYNDLAHEMIADTLLRRQGCHDYERDATYYYWSLSIPRGSKRFDSTYYHVFKIPFTNLYLIIIKSQTPIRASITTCSCDPYKTSHDPNLQECQSTCRLSCECPCKAGPATEPCHAKEADVHRSNRPLAACQPEGIATALNQTYTAADLADKESCFNYTCKDKSEQKCKRSIWCSWTEEEKCQKFDTKQCPI